MTGCLATFWPVDQATRKSSDVPVSGRTRWRGSMRPCPKTGRDRRRGGPYFGTRGEPPDVRRAVRIAVRRGARDLCCVMYGNENGWAAADAERAFGKAVRARRRASLARRVLRRCFDCARLMVVGGDGARRSGAGHGARDIPVHAIVGSLEPNRAAQFDSEFRPASTARTRWLSVWLAEHGGTVLPPVSVVPIGGDAYALRDGHHRVSVARARRALTISAKGAWR